MSNRMSTSAGFWTIVLEISVMMAQFPSRAIAELSYEFRTLGLGFCQHRRPLDDHGTSLRLQGRPLAVRRADRHHDRVATRTSAEMAKELGPFPGFRKILSTCCA